MPGTGKKLSTLMPKEPYETLDSHIIWQSQWYCVRQDRIRLPDGSEGQYNIVERLGGVWIVPVLPDGRLVLIRNYRYTIHDWLWEVPAGGLQPGISPLDMARRELAEEIGGVADSIEPITAFYTMPGIGNEKAHIFLAKGVKLGQPNHEPTEVMERHVFSIETVRAMITSGEMADGPSALAVLLCLPYL